MSTYATESTFVRRAAARFEDFFLAPASARPLAALRIGLAIILLVQVWLLRGSALDFLANDGMVQGALAAALGHGDMPKLSWLMRAQSALHLGSFPEETWIYLACGAYVSSVALLGLGLFTRPAAAVAWLLHWLMMNTADSANYGIDIYAHVFLFYLIWVPSNAMYSVDAARRVAGPAVSSEARLGLRLFQLHLCISYFFSAIEKSHGWQWWTGELIWRSVTMPQFRQFEFAWLANWPGLAQAIGIGALVLEGGYFVFMWPRRTRPLWLAGMVGMHLGISIFIGLHLFGLIMVLANVCAFAIPASPVRSLLRDRAKVPPESPPMGSASADVAAAS